MVIWNHRAQVHTSGLLQSNPMYSKANNKYLHNTKTETHNFPIKTFVKMSSRTMRVARVVFISLGGRPGGLLLGKGPNFT